MRRFPFLLLLIAIVALTSWYVSAQESPGSEVESSMKGEDLDGDGDVDMRDEILRRQRRGLGPTRRMFTDLGARLLTMRRHRVQVGQLPNRPRLCISGFKWPRWLLGLLRPRRI